MRTSIPSTFVCVAVAALFFNLHPAFSRSAFGQDVEEAPAIVAVDLVIPAVPPLRTDWKYDDEPDEDQERYEYTVDLGVNGETFPEHPLYVDETISFDEETTISWDNLDPRLRFHDLVCDSGVTTVFNSADGTTTLSGVGQCTLMFTPYLPRFWVAAPAVMQMPPEEDVLAVVEHLGMIYPNFPIGAEGLASGGREASRYDPELVIQRAGTICRIVNFAGLECQDMSDAMNGVEGQRGHGGWVYSIRPPDPPPELPTFVDTDTQCVVHVGDDGCQYNVCDGLWDEDPFYCPSVADDTVDFRFLLRPVFQNRRTADGGRIDLGLLLRGNRVAGEIGGSVGAAESIYDDRPLAEGVTYGAFSTIGWLTKSREWTIGPALRYEALVGVALDGDDIHEYHRMAVGIEIEQRFGQEDSWGWSLTPLYERAVDHRWGTSNRLGFDFAIGRDVGAWGRLEFGASVTPEFFTW